MRKALLCLVFAVLVVGPVLAAEEPSKATARTKAKLYVTAEEAYQLITGNDDKIVLVDVRDPVEIMFTGYTPMTDIHVPYKLVNRSAWDGRSGTYMAYHNPRFVPDMESALERIGANRQTPIIFMCRSGATRSGPAADAMFQRGYKNVYTMVDGFEGGKARSGPLKGARVVNGWKNSGLPWSYQLEEDTMYMVLQ